MKVSQTPSESLHQYAFAKLRVIERCPAKLYDAQKIDYLLHGLRKYILNAIAANRLPTVADFATCTSLDKSAQHIQANLNPSSFVSSMKPPLQSFRTFKPVER